jgi:hypothetical protein
VVEALTAVLVGDTGDDTADELADVVEERIVDGSWPWTAAPSEPKDPVPADVAGSAVDDPWSIDGSLSPEDWVSCSAEDEPTDGADELG